jgi:hypothetical protein
MKIFLRLFLFAFIALCNNNTKAGVSTSDSTNEYNHIPGVEYTTPVIECTGRLFRRQQVITFSSDNGQVSYQPEPDLCVKISGPGAPTLLFPYTTKQFVSPPLSLIPGVAYTIEIVICSTGDHKFIPVPSGSPIINRFPYINVTLTVPDCNPVYNEHKNVRPELSLGVLGVFSTDSDGGLGHGAVINVKVAIPLKADFFIPVIASYGQQNIKDIAGKIRSRYLITDTAISPQVIAKNTKADNFSIGAGIDTRWYSNRVSITTGFVIGYQVITQPEFTVQDAVITEANSSVKLQYLRSGKFKAAGIFFQPQIDLTYWISPVIGITLNAGYNIAPPFKGTTATWYGADANKNGFYTKEELQNGQAFTETVRQNVSSVSAGASLTIKIPSKNNK